MLNLIFRASHFLIIKIYLLYSAAKRKSSKIRYIHSKKNYLHAASSITRGVRKTIRFLPDKLKLSNSSSTATAS